jgi:hypothetical protein
MQAYSIYFHGIAVFWARMDNCKIISHIPIFKVSGVRFQVSEERRQRIENLGIQGFRN